MTRSAIVALIPLALASMSYTDGTTSAAAIGPSRTRWDANHMEAEGALAHVVARATQCVLGPPPPPSAVKASLVEARPRALDTSLLAPVAPIPPASAD